MATCNDCHTPQGLIPKYSTKASNGFWHSFAFTTGRFPEPLRIKPHNRAIAEKACRKCHGDIVEAENSSGFHAPEAERILAESVNFVRKGQLALREMKGRRESASR